MVLEKDDENIIDRNDVERRSSGQGRNEKGLLNTIRRRQRNFIAYGLRREKD